MSDSQKIVPQKNKTLKRSQSQKLIPRKIYALKILKPVCPQNKPYFHLQTQECSQVEESFADTDKPKNEVEKTPNQLTVVTTILVLANKTGYQSIDLSPIDGNFQRGDVLAFQFTRNSALLAVENGIKSVFIIRKVNFSPDTNLTFDKSEKKEHGSSIRVTYTKPFKYFFNAGQFTGGGIMNVEVLISHPLLPKDPIKIDKSVELSNDFCTLQFIKEFTATPEEEKIYLMEKGEYINLQVDFRGGNDMTITITVEGYDEPIITLKKDVYYSKQPTSIFPPGKLKLIATASNGKDSCQGDMFIETMKPIGKFEILSAKDDIMLAEDFNFTIKVIGGSDITIEVDYLDGQIKTENIAVASDDGHSITMTHRYNKCKKVQIDVIAYNKLNIYNKMRKSKEFRMICPLKDLKVITSPMVIKSNSIYLMSNQELKVTISIGSGSYVDFTIDWGDNNKTNVSNTKTKFQVEDYVGKHTYKTDGDYTVNIYAEGPTQKLSTSLFVIKKSCAPPTVNDIPITSETDPKRYIVTDIIKIKGTWSNPDTSCKKNIEDLFQPDKYYFLPSSKGHDFKKEGNSFVVEVGRKPEAIYNVEIRMRYNNSLFIKYNVFLSVSNLDIVAKILGGEKRVVPAKTLNKNGTEVYHDLKFSAEGSYDPSNRTDRLNGMSFNWTCLTDMNETCLLNKVFFPKYDAKFHINSQELTEGSVYKFHLHIQKGDRIATATQIVILSEYILPEVTITCIENCLEYVNVKEKIRYKYDCHDCPTKIGLHAKWIIKKEENGVFVTDENVTKYGMASEFDTPNLAISKDYLKENSSYKLILQVRFKIKNQSSESEYGIKTSQEPQHGKCIIDPKEGTSQTTNFLVECSQWESFDKKTLYYDYSYHFPSTNEKYQLGEYQNSSLNTQSSLSEIKLPAGHQMDNQVVVVVVKISDRFGMSKEVKLNVKVSPQQENVENMLAKLNDPKEIKCKPISQLMSAIIDLVNKALNEYDEKVRNLEDIEVNKITNMTNKNKEKELEEARKNFLSLLKEIIYASTKALLTCLNDEEAPIKKKDSNIGLVIRNINDILKTLLVLTEYSSFVSLQTQDLQLTISKHICDVIQRRTNEISEIPSSSRQNLMDDTFHCISNLNEALVHVENQYDNIRDNGNKNNEVYMDDDSVVTYEELNKTTEYLYETKDFCSKVVMDLVNASTMTDETLIKLAYKAFTVEIQKIRMTELHEAKFDNVAFPPDMLDSNDVADSVLAMVTSETKETSETGLNQETEGQSADSPNLSSGTTIVRLGNMKVDSLEVPIAIRFNDSVVEGTNVTLYHPSDYTTVSMDVKQNCDLMVDIGYDESPENPINLTVYMQYAIAPSPDSYDIKIEFHDGKVNIAKGDETAVASRNGKKVNVKRKVNFKKINGVLVLLNVTSFTFADFVGDKPPYMHYAIKYEGNPIPVYHILNDYTFDDREVRLTQNVTLRAWCKMCLYRSETQDNGNWSSYGLYVDWEKTTKNVTFCNTTHLSAFGSFYVAPNPLPAFSLDLLKEGFVLLVTVLVLLLLWLLGLVIARRVDKNDFSKIGVSPLADNKPGDSYLYEVTVNTGNRRHAGTNSKVFFAMAGVDGKTQMRRLEDPERAPFQTSSVDIFILATAEPLGDLTYIQIWHDNSGGSWYLRSVEVVDLQTEEKDVFLAARWLAVDKLDGRLDCVIHAASDKDLQEFNYLFTSKTRRDFSDAHLWFSVYLRPPRSSFTRCQRLSVAFCLLFTSMISSVMFYGAVPAGSAKEENRIAGFSFRWTQVYIAVISAIITVPINLLLVALFRSIKPDYLKRVSENAILPNDSRRESTAEIIVSQTEESTAIDFSAEDVEQRDSPKRKREKKFYLPSWCLIPAWILCVIVILACAFFVVWYGMAFGNRKSLDWLASISISLVQDIVVMQPIKVFIIALFVALIVKKIDEEEKSEVEKQTSDFTKDNSWLNKLKEETTVFDRVEAEDLHPPDLSQLGWMREIRIKEVQMYAITREIILYLVFTCLVFIIGYFTRDNDSFLQTRNIEELLSLKPRKSFGPSKPGESPKSINQIRSSADFWPWMDELFLPEVFPTPWYNLDSAYDDTPAVRDFPGNIFLNDLNSKIVNGIRLRQVRVKPESCDKAPDVEDIIDLPCGAEYGFSTEETRDFDHNWTLPYEPTDGLTPINKPWRYQSWSDLDAYPVWAELDTYFGGGYVVEIFPRWDNPEMLRQLKDGQWIDRYSRAVIIEFTLYNAATNYFNAMTIVIEFPPGGGVVPFFSAMTFRLYRLTNSAKIFVIACEALFLLFMIMFTVREMKLIYRSRWSYFTEFWNLVELSNIFLTVAAIVVYIYRDTLGSDLLSRLPAKRPENFINFQFAAYVDSIFTYIIALICFFVTLKFIKLLRFNRRISLLSYTLKKAWFPLSMFGVTFSIILIATIISSSLIFGTTLYDYRNVLNTIAPIIGLLLGKFRYSEFEEGNRVLGPVFFLAFNVMVNWIIMNMMIAILTDTFVEVQEEVLAQSNDYEIIDFVVGHFKDWLGLQNSKQAIDELIDENMGQPDDDDSEKGSPSRRPTVIQCGKRKVSDTTVVEDLEEPIFVGENSELPACLKYTDDDEYTLEELFEMADKCALLFEKKLSK